MTRTGIDGLGACGNGACYLQEVRLGFKACGLRGGVQGNMGSN